MPRALPLRINIRDCIVLVLLVIFNTINVTDMANNNMDIIKEKKSTKESNDKVSNRGEVEDYLKSCPFLEQDSIECSSLQYPCIVCNRSIDCRYGGFYNYTCVVKPKVACNGSKTFNRTAMCRFCYQSEKWEHRCDQKANCNSLASPLKYYSTNCTVSDDVICLGNRRFLKKIRCSWTAGTRWGTALILALTLGGFGADRFYLGHWQEGIGKLFSFGGLGVWTLVDALLIGIHHLGPADGSLYI
ncbi:TM2 domain-containing protein almondex [Pectinophora gossypiella]|uniref:TM2 domain-containing protein almondex n=1 Tax=Pectinophora gossypiella TaxID=13191 RepID=UPI00214E8861|nr:TM2 domain-containing protein almondex [Pectinophora gossypiella]